jgi:hypothetical protein
VHLHKYGGAHRQDERYGQHFDTHDLYPSCAGKRPAANINSNTIGTAATEGLLDEIH